MVVYHAFPTLLPRGFVGVDVFFAISGYLITATLWDAKSCGGASLLPFYERRLRRLAPALLAMLLVIGAAATIWLLPTDLINFSYSALAAIGLSANFYFWGQGDYFFSSAVERLLLHTWSLGVEEQFYLLFPALLALLRKRRQTGAVLGSLTCASLALNVFALTIGADVPAFYLLPTRAWELGAGAILFLSDRRLPTAFGWIGLLLIGIAFTSVVPDVVPAGLPAVAGAVLIMGSGAPAILSYPPLVFVGLISYSLYLWHWPLLALARYRAVEPLSGVSVAALVALSIAVSAASWRWIEVPLRRPSVSMRRFACLTGAAVALSIGGAITLVGTGGLPGRFPKEAERWNASENTHYRCGVSKAVIVNSVRGCKLVGDPASAQVLLLGNSAAQMYAPALAKVLLEKRESGVALTFNGCLPVLGPNITRLCSQIATKAIVAAARTSAKIVVVGTTWDKPLSGLSAALQLLRHSGKKVILIGPVAAPGVNVTSLAARRAAFGLPVGPLAMPRAEFDRRYGQAAAQFRYRSDLTFIEPALRQCDGTSCPYVHAGWMVFSDGVHLSRNGALLFSPDLKRAIP